LWKNLAELFLRHRRYLALGVKNNRAGAGFALIESKNIFHSLT
jgi:hypothetical protein